MTDHDKVNDMIDSIKLRLLQHDFNKLKSIKDAITDPHMFELMSGVVDKEEEFNYMEYLCRISLLTDKFIEQIKNAAKR